MKILHICMAQYSDGWTYQENLLAKYHKAIGNEVTMLTSQFCYKEGKLQEDINHQFNDVNGVKVIRLQKKTDGFLKKMPLYKEFYETLVELNPDIIFSHGCQYRDIRAVVQYVKVNPNVKLFVDNHADFSNSATNFISKEILHKIIWKHYAQMLIPFTKRFWGVMPSRVDFLHDVYGIPKEKIGLLVMGADDEYVEKSSLLCQLSETRKLLKINKNDFTIVTGGKIDSAKKQTLLLMEAVASLNIENLKLIVFGSISEDIKRQADKWIDNNKIKYVGWADAEQSYNYFAIADLVVFPGRHSVFWEQVAGQGKPMLVKDWPGTHHIDLGGNVMFLKNDSVEEIRCVIGNIVNNRSYFNTMKIKAEQAMLYFSYAEISKRSTEII